MDDREQDDLADTVALVTEHLAVLRGTRTHAQAVETLKAVAGDHADTGSLISMLALFAASMLLRLDGGPDGPSAEALLRDFAAAQVEIRLEGQADPG
jgi:hypothetical protein